MKRLMLALPTCAHISSCELTSMMSAFANLPNVSLGKSWFFVSSVLSTDYPF
jgi:hypothetical protein